MRNPVVGLWGLLALLFLGIFLFQQGMFLDGITYAAISRNLSLGLGSIWKPFYSQTICPEFYGHPPFHFVLQSLFFHILGDFFWVERLYSLLCFVWVSIFLAKIEKLFEDSQAISPLIFLLIPVIPWAFQNNLLENTMSVFVGMCSYFCLKGLKNQHNTSVLIASLCLAAGFWTKGFVALFPLSIPILYAFNFSVPFAKTAKNLILLFVPFLLITFTILSYFPESKTFWKKYLEIQLMPALAGKGEVTVGSRWQLLFTLFKELWILIFLFLIFKKFVKIPIEKKHFAHAKFMLSVAVVGSFPLMITLKQRNFYLVPSLMFYALGFSFLLNPYFEHFLENHKNQLLRFQKGIWGLLVAVTIASFALYGSYSRDKNKIQFIQQVKSKIPTNSIVGTQSLCEDWTMIAYFARYSQISLSCDTTMDWLIEKSDDEPTGYQLIFHKNSTK